MSDTIAYRGQAATSTETLWAGPEEPQATYADAKSMPDTHDRDTQLAALTSLASVNIETSMAADLSGSLHRLFDDVCDEALPIYFGPLLGRLYLEGL